MKQTSLLICLLLSLLAHPRAITEGLENLELSVSSLPPISDELRVLVTEFQTSAQLPAGFESVLQRLIATGDPVAMFLYSMLFLKDEPAEALGLMKQSAIAGCPGALTAWAMTVFKNRYHLREFIELIEKSALAGDALAQFFLASGYRSGAGYLPRNLPRAYALLQRAAQQTPSRYDATG